MSEYRCDQILPQSAEQTWFSNLELTHTDLSIYPYELPLVYHLNTQSSNLHPIQHFN